MGSIHGQPLTGVTNPSLSDMLGALKVTEFYTRFPANIRALILHAFLKSPVERITPTIDNPSTITPSNFQHLISNKTRLIHHANSLVAEEVSSIIKVHRIYLAEEARLLRAEWGAWPTLMICLAPVSHADESWPWEDLTIVAVGCKGELWFKLTTVLREESDVKCWMIEAGSEEASSVKPEQPESSA